MDATIFRKELVKILPGYKWTVHKPNPYHLKSDPPYFKATGIQSSGFNRLSTIEVEYREPNGQWYSAKIAGFGKRSGWRGSGSGSTMARAFRALQEHLEWMASEYAGCARYIESARAKKEEAEPKRL